MQLWQKKQKKKNEEALYGIFFLFLPTRSNFGLVVMGLDIPAHDLPQVIDQQVVNLMVGVVASDRMVTVREVMGLVTMVASKGKTIHQHKWILHMDIIYNRVA